MYLLLDMTQKMLKEEYCKAVDDFAESVKNLIADSPVIRFKDIDEIAEQLKAGGEYAGSREVWSRHQCWEQRLNSMQ